MEFFIDSYAKVIFSVGAKQMKSKKTKTIKNSISPVFKESFTFALTVDKLDQAGISVQIMQTKGTFTYSYITILTLRKY